MAERDFKSMALDLAKTYISSRMQRTDLDPIRPEDLEEILKKSYIAIQNMDRS